MILPAGTVSETVTNPQKEELFRYLASFLALIEIETECGHGFILNENGKLVGAYFKKNNYGIFRGKSAFLHLAIEATGTSESPKIFKVRKYTGEEFSRAVQIAQKEDLLINGTSPGVTASDPDIKINKSSKFAEYLNKTTLNKIKTLNGVIAVITFFDGFPIQCIGDADFEHVAASAEDLMREGTKIAQELKIGSLDQIILETDEKKFIIAPCGDLHLCVFTTADAHLGLIRVILKSIQSEIPVEISR
ncbi:MAG: roadblock/LC7 domain-containing protein [Methanoregula sp.]|jgi:predicted regulator of Ras-like GTPase activity (Roadblock/LC7/MglB family)|nr:roadblock/LC7 domain-containing protein [Methanoregula sp.]